VVLSKYWRNGVDGPIAKHDHARPIDDTTDLPVGVWWACPTDTCKIGEWVFAGDNGAPGHPKRPFCPDHGGQLRPRTANTRPAAVAGPVRQRAIDARRAAAAATAARVEQIRAAGRTEAQRIAADARERASAAVSAHLVSTSPGRQPDPISRRRSASGWRRSGCQHERASARSCTRGAWADLGDIPGGSLPPASAPSVDASVWPRGVAAGRPTVAPR
jgi:hypothetical protein